MQESID
jgi:hypothetical protein